LILVLVLAIAKRRL